MDYQESLDWIMSFWELGRSRAEERRLRHLKVPRMRLLLERLGSPQLSFPSVLVAGTKGKGSTCAFLAEALRSAGYRTGRYTQPHLIDWRERSWVDGCIIEPDQVASIATRIRPAVEELNRESQQMGALTTYEVGTAVTLCHFADQRVDAAVLEIGVGGRLDALNALDPVLSVLTSISYDHTDVLGSTLAEIAREKAGIFRGGHHAVSASQPPEAAQAVRDVAAELGATLHEVGREWMWERGEVRPHPNPLPEGEGIVGSSPSAVRSADSAEAAGGDASPLSLWERDRVRASSFSRHQVRALPLRPDQVRACPGSAVQRFSVSGPVGQMRDLEIPLLGDHQLENATVAVAALQLLEGAGLPVGEGAIRQGLANVEWPGRAQLLCHSPRVVADAAHNVDSVQRLLETVKSSYPYRRLILVFGASGDKDVSGMAAVLGPESGSVVVTGSGHRRAAGLGRLADLFCPYAAVQEEADPAEALKIAMGLAGEGDLVLVTGSVFLAGRAIEQFENRGFR